MKRLLVIPLVFLILRVDSQNMAVGNALPCGEDNLSCVNMMNPDDPADCLTTDQLCDGTQDCASGLDEGVQFASLDCAFGNPRAFRCTGGEVVQLQALCDGFNNCTSGEDERTLLCENKCRLPYYGACEFTRECVHTEVGQSCGLCLPGYTADSTGDPVLGPCIPVVTLTLDATSYNGSEDDPTVQVCVSGSVGTGDLNDIAGESFEVDLALSNGTAIGDGEDYEWTSSPAVITLTFDSTNLLTPQCFGITIINDDLIEFEEMFTVTLTTPNNPRGQILLQTSSASVSIIDDDVATFSLTPATYTVGEDIGNAVVVIEIVGGTLTFDIEIDFETVEAGSTAIAGADYTATSVTLTFLAGTTNGSAQRVNVPIIEDGAVEPDEIINIRIFGLSASTDHAVIDRDSGNGLITIITPLQCSSPGNIQNGMVTFTGTFVGDTATYSCDAGFELIGGAITTCTQMNAAFEPAPPSCRPLCPDPDDIDNGMVTFTGSSIGDTATYSCDLDFVLIGGATTTCTLVDANSAAFQPAPPSCGLFSTAISWIESRLMNEQLTGVTLEDIIVELAVVISVADDPTEQTNDSVRVVVLVFGNISTSVNTIHSTDINVQITMSAVEIVDDLQRWPEQAIVEGGPDIIWSLEIVLINLVQQEDFTGLRLLEECFTLQAERVELDLLQLNGRGFFVSRNNGILRSSTGAVRSEEELTSEEISLALLPPSLFENFTDSAIGIFFTFYKNASPFPVANVPNTTRIGSPVVGATVVAGEQTSFSDLIDPVTVTVRLNPVQEGNITRRTCVSWNFSLADGRGNWSAEGCNTVETDDPDVVICRCFHLTNFAVLVDISTGTDGIRDLSPEAELALDIISIVGIGLSMLGLVLTVFTLLAFKNLRQNEATKFHIQLCIAIFCMLLVFLVGIGRVPPDNLYEGCVAVSALIHYFTLAAVMWMGAEALLMFGKLVIVFVRIHTKHIIAASIICWTLPLVAVGVPLGIDRDFMLTYRDTNSSDEVEFCFIGDVRVFFGAFLGPIGVILIFNSIIFVMVAYVAIRHRKRHLGKGTPKQKIFGLIFRLVGVMFLFGLAWAFGALTILSETSLVFQILFAVFNSSQGFFLFLFFCVLNNEARKSWKSLLCGHFKQSSPPVSRTKASNPLYPSTASRSTAETSQSDSRRIGDLRRSEGSDQIDIGSAVGHVVENPVTMNRPSETSLGTAANGVTIIENRYADPNGQPRSHAQLASVGIRERRTIYAPPGQLIPTENHGLIV